VSRRISAASHPRSGFTISPPGGFRAFPVRPSCSGSYGEVSLGPQRLAVFEFGDFARVCPLLPGSLHAASSLVLRRRIKVASRLATMCKADQSTLLITERDTNYENDSFTSITFELLHAPCLRWFECRIGRHFRRWHGGGFPCEWWRIGCWGRDRACGFGHRRGEPPFGWNQRGRRNVESKWDENLRRQCQHGQHWGPEL
jgi:hypothetical protein